MTIQDDDVDVKKQKTENGHDAENGEDEEDAEEEEDLGEEEEDLDGEGEDELDEEDGGEGEYSTQSWGQIRTTQSFTISRCYSLGLHLPKDAYYQLPAPLK